LELRPFYYIGLAISSISIASARYGAFLSIMDYYGIIIANHGEVVEKK
jgi:hypothetical protein